MTPSDRKAVAKLIEEDSKVDESIDDEPTSEELVGMLKQAIREANEGKTRPASEVMGELREMLAADDDASRNR